MDLYYKVIDNKYKTVKEVLREEFSISSRLYLKLRNAKQIFLNSNFCFGNENLSLNDVIEVDLNFEEESPNIVETKMDLNILYEDNYILVLDKPANMAIHPSIRHYDTTLSNGVKYYFNQINLHRKIRIVNRLDKDTSGVVVFAKNEYIQECLIKQMKNNIFKKEYIAILEGILNKKEGTINAPISRKEGSIIERCISQDGQPAITHYNIVKELDNLSLVHFVLETRKNTSNTCTF